MRRKVEARLQLEGAHTQPLKLFGADPVCSNRRLPMGRGESQVGEHGNADALGAAQGSSTWTRRSIRVNLSGCIR
jgi:hypothetical protein